ncbi:MAG: hypothetical protein COX14_00760 [Chloroflexi bacterium CG23_combo_of_CG06-09_8_20_14_all_45_10]|nr:MAG: hypothetical protein COX14_00760 [Chloroflexi bacterium CG23_combo_of_CG06-09_8_20_14_all_45_10]
MRKGRWLYLAVAVVCLFSLIVVGCAKPAPATPTEPTTPTPPAMKAQEWKLSSYYAEPHPRAQMDKKFKELIEKRTNGLITINIYPGESLFPGTECLSAVATRAVEVSQVPPQYSEAKHPISGVFSPWGYWNEEKWLKYGPEVIDIVNKDPKGFEAAGVKLLFASSLCDYYLISRTPISKPEDLVGKLVRSGGGLMGKCIKAIGGEPARISAAETYAALQRGTLDGGWMEGQRVIADKLWEVAPYGLSGPGWSAVVVCYYMNLDLFNTLPKEYQKIVLDVSQETFEFGVKLERQLATEAKATIEPKMKGFLWMSSDEVLRWRAKQDPVIEEYVKTYGENARRLVEIMKK